MNEEKNEQPYTSLYEGARCGKGHELEFISEGFALCFGESVIGTPLWWSWSMGPATGFCDAPVIGRDGSRITAYVGYIGQRTRDEAIAIIDRAMQTMREQPYDEERERPRLIPV